MVALDQYIVYRTTNTANGKIYVGAHHCKGTRCRYWRVSRQCTYIGSGTIMKRAIALHGAASFKREVLVELGSRQEMYDYEKWLVTQSFADRPDTYNVLPGGLGSPRVVRNGVLQCHRVGRVVSDETRRKIGDASRGRRHSPETRAYLATLRVGVPRPDYIKQILREANIGRAVSAETREKLRKSLTGRKGPARSAETRAKMSAHQRGVPKPKAVCLYCGKVGSNSGIGRYHQEKCKEYRNVE